MKAGAVSVLLIHDSNPVYSLPPDAGLRARRSTKVDFVVSFASLPDETSERADLILPDHTPLESWGDAAPRPGVRSLVQPTHPPALRHPVAGRHAARRRRAPWATDVGGSSPRGQLPQRPRGRVVRHRLARGARSRRRLRRDARATRPPVSAERRASLEFGAPKLEGSGAFIAARPPVAAARRRQRREPAAGSRRLPDPVTKRVPGSPGPRSAARPPSSSASTLGDVLAIATPSAAVEVPVFPRGGIRDDVIARGHRPGPHASGTTRRSRDDGRPGEARGVNVISLLPGADATRRAAAPGSPPGPTSRPPAATSACRSPSAPTTSAVASSATPSRSAALAKAGDGAAAHFRAASRSDAEHPRRRARRSPTRSAGPSTPTDRLGDPEIPYRWGMTIDLDRCTGCSACVGGLLRSRTTSRWSARRRCCAHRQMTWLRIERYVGDGDQELRARPAAPASTTKSSARSTCATRRCCASSAAPRPASRSARSSRPTTTTTA